MWSTEISYKREIEPTFEIAIAQFLLRKQTYFKLGEKVYFGWNFAYFISILLIVHQMGQRRQVEYIFGKFFEEII